MHKVRNKIARRVTASAGGASSARALLLAWPSRLSPGKDFLGDVRKSPGSRSRMRNQARLRCVCFSYHSIVGFTGFALICIVPAASDSPLRLSRASAHRVFFPGDNRARYLSSSFSSRHCVGFLSELTSSCVTITLVAQSRNRQARDSLRSASE